MFFLFKFFILSLILTIYYKFTKEALIRLAHFLSDHLAVSKKIPRSDVQGVLELVLIACSHLIFCLTLVYFFPVPLRFHQESFFTYFIYAILLGIGCMGTSSLLCNIVVQVINHCSRHPQDLKTWLTIGRGGWMKHHLQSFEILPVYISVFILLMQVGSEEMVFRSIIFHYFMPFGTGAALCLSIMLFVIMQIFLTHRWQCSVFPMTGAFAMGIFHSVLYWKVPMIWPLVISHVVFFIFSVL